jgi:hypothetical protein
MGTESNDEPNGDRTDIERESNERVNESVNERMRELGRRSGEARRRKAKAKQTDEREPLTDREQAMAALRRALDGGNMAAMVSAAKALLEFDHSPRDRPVTVEDAREQLEARLNAIEDHRRRNGEVCSACGGSGIVVRAPGRGEGAGIDGGRGASFPGVLA